LHHVLFEVLCQPWCGPLVKSLERSGFNDFQDVLVMNQAEREMLNFLNANDVLATPMPDDKKEMLLNFKLFSCFCEENGKPIMDWRMKISKAEINQVTSSATCYRAVKTVTIPPSCKFNFSRPDIATVPKNVTSAPMISLSSSPSAAIPSISSSALASATPVSKHHLFSESQDVEAFSSNIFELQHVLHTILPEAIDSPLDTALENHGLITVQDVLLLNQAERDALHFLKAAITLSTLSIGYKIR